MTTPTFWTFSIVNEGQLRNDPESYMSCLPTVVTDNPLDAMEAAVEALRKEHEMEIGSIPFETSASVGFEARHEETGSRILVYRLKLKK